MRENRRTSEDANKQSWLTVILVVGVVKKTYDKKAKKDENQWRTRLMTMLA